MKTFAPAIVAALAALAGLTASAPAQDTTATRLDTVVVSATKTPAAAGAVTQSVTVITGEQLRATGVEWVADALRLVPGAQVARSGSFGSVTSLFLRGGETRYTKVLLDGVAVNSVGGYFDFSDLSTEHVERIEIVRGPGSVVHGADAMTGVVHVITRRGTGRGALEVDARGGSYSTRDVGATLSAGGERVQYSVGGARYSTDGTLPFNNTYRNGTLSGSARITAGQRSSVVVSSRYGDARYHYPTDFMGIVEDSNSYRDQRRLTLGIDAAHRLSDALELRLLGGFNDVTDNTDDVDPPPPWVGGTDQIHSRYAAHTRRRNAEARAIWRVRQAVTLTSGLEYVNEDERTTSSEAPAGSPLVPISELAGRRETRVAFAELTGRAAMTDLTVSGRIDDPSDFGTFATYRLAAGWSVGAVRLHGNVGSAFNAPSFSQLLPTEFTVGSPDLKPEHALSFEFGARWRAPDERFLLRAVRFNQRFHDLIQFVSGGPPDFLGSFANLARVRADGWELEGQALLAPRLIAAGSFTALDARVNRVDAGYDGPLQPGQKLVRRARRSATASLGYAGGRGSASFAVRHVGARPDLDFREFPSPVVQLPSHTVADLAATVRLLTGGARDQLSLTLRVQNLFDAAYEEILYYPAPGRTILLGARAGLSLR